MQEDNHDQASEAESSVSRLLWNGVLAIALVIAALLAAAAVFPRQTQALMALASGLWQSEAPAQARINAPPEDAEPALRLPPVTPTGTTPSEPVPATAATIANANSNANGNGEANTPESPGAPAAPASIETPTSPPAKLSAPPAPVALAPAASASAAPAPAAAAITAGGDVRAALEKIKSLNKNSFFVQHVALDNYEEAQLWRRQYPSLSGALISAIQVEGGRRLKYVVVSGPFADRAAANEYAKRADIPQDSWIRTVRSLQDAAPAAARRP